MSFKNFWSKLSFIGLRADQEFSHRDVVLLNKLVFISAILMLLLIPVEVLVNGWEIVPIEISISFLSLFTLYLNHLKRYTVAKIYFYITALAIVMGMAVLVGPGFGNEMFLVPLFIYGGLMFERRIYFIVFAFISFTCFYALDFIQEAIPPIYDLDPSLKQPFRLALLCTSFTILFFAVYYFKSINFKFQRILSVKNGEIEEKNKEIVDSINYAERIQAAYLPKRELLDHYFEESFLYFKPKDIVSGDFYWFYSAPSSEGLSTNDVFIIAADCTGHGVPGALMSVICCNALNDVVVTKGERNPGKILDGVRDNIVRILNTDDGNKRKDGMDVTICKINTESCKVEYSGANNPLWILRRGADEIEVMKVQKQAVGYSERAEPFTSTTMQLTKGDKLYLFSDGYQDQFGGEKGKKFKAANLKKLLVAEKSKSMQDQLQVIDQTFLNWKGDLEQVDDVCIIGVRV